MTDAARAASREERVSPGSIAGGGGLRADGLRRSRPAALGRTCAVGLVVGGLILGIARGARAQERSPVADAGETSWLRVGGQRFKARIYRSSTLDPHPVLVVVLHGDSPFRPPSYQYAFARAVAARLDDVVAVAVLRPGYTDGAGDRSDGERGLTTGDNYTPEVVDAIGQATDQLKARFRPGATVLVGHSGGAAISAILLGRRPGEVAAALLVSCPCDLAAWRAHMLAKSDSARIWLQPIRSISPLAVVGDIPSPTRVDMLVGSRDDVAPPELSRVYADALRRSGGQVTLTIVPGLEHDMLLEPVVLDHLRALTGRVGASR